MKRKNEMVLSTDNLNPTKKKQKKKKLSPVALKPFWNTRSEEISRRLPSRNQNTISYIVKGNLWTHNPYTALSRDDEEKKRIVIPLDEIKEQDDEKNKKFKTKRIRIYPTKEQKKIIEKWFAACRWSYNQCAEAINEKTLPVNKKELRAKFLHSRNFETENQWIKQVPSDLRNAAILDTLKALKAYRAKKKENQNGFKFKFRSRFDAQNVAISKTHWGHTRKKSMFRLVLSNKVLRSSKHDPLPEKLLHDSRLIRDKLHRYFLCIPILLEQKIARSSSSTKIVALDPGVRTFMTTYDQDGEVHEFGKGDRTRLFRLALSVDRLTSKRAKVKKNRHRKRNMQKAILRIYDRIRNLVDDAHKKIIKWLCENHQTILIPKFESSKMVKREGRRLHTKAVRGMLHWAHYRFREKLLKKAQEYEGVQVKVVTEEYTSKTCGVCGIVHEKLGGNKVFLCPSCHWKCDRDINGARNIMLKYLTEHAQKTSTDSSVGSLGPSPFSLFVKVEEPRCKTSTVQTVSR